MPPNTAKSSHHNGPCNSENGGHNRIRAVRLRTEHAESGIRVSSCSPALHRLRAIRASLAPGAWRRGRPQPHATERSALSFIAGGGSGAASRSQRSPFQRVRSGVGPSSGSSEEARRERAHDRPRQTRRTCSASFSVVLSSVISRFLELLPPPDGLHDVIKVDTTKSAAWREPGGNAAARAITLHPAAFPAWTPAGASSRTTQ